MIDHKLIWQVRQQHAENYSRQEVLGCVVHSVLYLSLVSTEWFSSLELQGDHHVCELCTWRLLRLCCIMQPPFVFGDVLL